MPEGDEVRWYVVHTYSGYENKVKEKLEHRIDSMHMKDKIFEIAVPSENILEYKAGKKQLVEKKLLPGYLLVKMKLDDDSWYVVRNTPGVTGFVGTPAKPTPIPEEEVSRVLTRQETDKPKVSVEFSEGDGVKVIEGPFADFTGTVGEVSLDQHKLKVLLSIFGRETPVELSFEQVVRL
ncbi:MAG: transcription termination/antitermination protein NusG [Actinomycetota bacterium]|nr:transcription termination/antitermination protein NusG [Actinomycetota bacterium]